MGLSNFDERDQPRILFAATLRDRIAEDLRNRVLTGQLKAGAKLSLDDLADEFGSSRTPVREALIELSHDGLVDLAPRRGVTVIGITREGLLDTFNTFAAVAGVAAEWATRAADRDLSGDLRELNARLGRTTDVDSSVEANWQFHATLNRACGSPRLLATIRQLGRTVPAGFIRVVPEQAEFSIREHDEIVAAVARGDALGARVASEQHLRDAGERMLKRLEEQGVLT